MFLQPKVLSSVPIHDPDVCAEFMELIIKLIKCLNINSINARHLGWCGLRDGAGIGTFQFTDGEKLCIYIFLFQKLQIHSPPKLDFPSHSFDQIHSCNMHKNKYPVPETLSIVRQIPPSVISKQLLLFMCVIVAPSTS